MANPLQKMDNLIKYVDHTISNLEKEQQKKPVPNKLLSDISRKQKSKNKSSHHPSNIQLPQTPQLPTANVRLPWSNEPINMKILMFYHSKPHIFGCQFSNLFYSPFEINTKWVVPTNDGTTQTLMTYELSNSDEKMSENTEFQSSESVFQSAKAKHKIDALFVRSLSPGDAARAGQARLKMSNGLANKYKKFGGKPFKIKQNHWQFSEKDKRYEKRRNWHSYKVEIMNYALRLKFRKYYYLIKEYVDSEVPIYFVEHTKNDTQWADGSHGKGTNYLGKLLTVLCCEFRLIRDGLDMNDIESMNIKWTIDTMSNAFLEWLNVDNIDVIENGEQFYKDNQECEWLK